MSDPQSETSAKRDYGTVLSKNLRFEIDQADERGRSTAVAVLALAFGILLSTVFYRAMLQVEEPDPLASLVLGERFKGCLTYDGRVLGPISGQILGWDSPGIRLTAVLYEDNVPYICTALFRFNRLNQLVSFEGRVLGPGPEKKLRILGVNPLRSEARSANGEDARAAVVRGPLLLLPVAGGRTLHYPALERELLTERGISPVRRFAIAEQAQCSSYDPAALSDARRFVEAMADRLR